jgi:thioredoxin-like negative regulator of GroEL
LTRDDFRLTLMNSMTVLSHEIKGFSVVLFYSPQCVYCKQFIPIFKHLPDVLNGCQFAMINVSVNKSLVTLSQQSNTPITYVPLIILYINGRPYIRYTGPLVENDLRRFIIDVSNKVHESGFTHVLKTNGIPDYSMGKPLYGEDEVSYLQFNDQLGYYIKPT